MLAYRKKEVLGVCRRPDTGRTLSVHEQIIKYRDVDDAQKGMKVCCIQARNTCMHESTVLVVELMQSAHNFAFFARF